MAKTLETFDFGKSYSERAAKYPWDQWLNGDIWQLTQGTDFVCQPKSIPNAAYKACRDRSEATGTIVKVRVRVTDEKNVVLQAFAPEPKPAPLVAAA